MVGIDHIFMDGSVWWVNQEVEVLSTWDSVGYDQDGVPQSQMSYSIQGANFIHKSHDLYPCIIWYVRTYVHTYIVTYVCACCLSLNVFFECVYTYIHMYVCMNFFCCNDVC